MKKSIIIWAVAIILVAVAVYTTYQYNNSPTPAPTEQAETPSQTPEQNASEEVVESIDALDFTLKDMNGNKVSLSDYKGKNIFVNFWASWCGPCTYEMPFIEQLYQDNKDSDLVVITVNLKESKKVVGDFLTENKYNLPVWLDSENEVAKQYGIGGIPLSLMINKDFKIIAAHEGAMENYKMLKDFVNLVNE